MIISSYARMPSLTLSVPSAQHPDVYKRQMILLALMLIMGLAPMTASAEPGTENKATSVTVSNVTLNDGDCATTDEDGTVRKRETGEEKYNVMFSDGILYLRNATIVASSGNHGINANGDITIDISGINSVTGGSNSQGAEEASDGIFAKGDIDVYKRQILG